jgi:hypothetical protein
MKFKYLACALIGCAAATSLHAQDAGLIERFGRTCYTVDAAKRAEADALMADFRQKTTDPTEAYKKLQSLDAAAVIGHPDAFLFKCRIGADKGGPPAFAALGRVWCAAGLTKMPALASKLEPEYVAQVKSEEAGMGASLAQVNARLCKPQ